MYKRVLFVCTGNTCRSVMAEKLLKKMLEEEGIKDIRVESAGIAALPSYRIFGSLKDVMKNEGIDISDHRVRFLKRDMIEEADLILVMGNDHKKSILGRVPEVKNKLFLLKEFAGEKGNLEIPDPIGQGKNVYERTLEDIREILKKILPKIIY